MTKRVKMKRITMTFVLFAALQCTPTTSGEKASVEAELVSHRTLEDKRTRAISALWVQKSTLTLVPLEDVYNPHAYCSRTPQLNTSVPCRCPEPAYAKNTKCEGIVDMFCEIHSCPPTAQCFTNGIVIECAEFANRDTIVPCVNDLCTGAGVSGKCFLVYGVPRCCSRDAALCHNSYTDGPSVVYSPRAIKDMRNRLPSVPLFGVGTQVIAIDHESTHRRNHQGVMRSDGQAFTFSINPDGDSLIGPAAHQSISSSTSAISAMTVGALVAGVLFFIVSLVLLVCGAHTWSCTVVRSDYDSWSDEKANELESSADGEVQRNSEKTTAYKDKVSSKRLLKASNKSQHSKKGTMNGTACSAYATYDDRSSPYKHTVPVSNSMQMISNTTTETQLTPSTPGCGMDMQCVVEVHDEMMPRRNRSPVVGRRTPVNVGRPISVLEQQHVTSVTGRPQRSKERHPVIA